MSRTHPSRGSGVQSTNLALNRINVNNNSDGDANGGHNTDAFDVSQSNGVTIRKAIVKNQYDCLAVNSAINIPFTGGTCSSGYGLSIGSIGGRDDSTVSNVAISHSAISNSANGIRIKTITGATGKVSLVTFNNMQLSGIADYENGSPGRTPTSGVPFTDLTVQQISGSVGRDSTPV